MNQPGALHELNRNYVRSVLESDVRWFDANLAPDFVNSNPDGSLADRAAFLKQVAAPCAVSKLREDDVHINVLGDVAIVYARTTYAKPDGKPGAGRYTDVWQLREERWLCVSANVSRG
jgi:ketosteroid isomerase-like protein